VSGGGGGGAGSNNDNSTVVLSGCRCGEGARQQDEERDVLVRNNMKSPLFVCVFRIAVSWRYSLAKI